MTDRTPRPGGTPAATADAEAVAPGGGSSAESALGMGVATGTERVGSLWHDAWRELRRNPIFLVSCLLLVVFITMAIAPQLYAFGNPYALDACQLSNSLGRPSAQHWFGFNFQGCDLWDRTVYGARASISVGVLVTLFSTVLGAAVGAFAGFYGRWLDALLSRVVDIFFAIPLLLGAIVFLTVVKLPGIWGVVTGLTLLGWTSAARIMRSTVISTRTADYVMAARALGAGDLRLLRRHILPNAMAPVIVVATINLGIIIAVEATLSYLGVGLQPPTISWGIEISDAQQRVLQAPHVLLFPAMMLSLTVLSFILLGDAVRDALDPKLR